MKKIFLLFIPLLLLVAAGCTKVGAPEPASDLQQVQAPPAVVQ